MSARQSSTRPLERTQPLLPMGFGYVEGVTHDSVRHGTTTLFAALDVANGQVISRVRTQHRHQEFLDFLRQIDKQTPPDLDLHLIADNYITHKHAKVKAWRQAEAERLTAERRPDLWSAYQVRKAPKNRTNPKGDKPKAL